MPITNININDFKKPLGQNRSEHTLFKDTLPIIIQNTLTNLTIRNIDIYDLAGETHNHQAGVKGDRLVMFLNTSSLNSSKDDNGYFAPKGDGVVLYSRTGQALAEWREEDYELNILFDVCHKYDDEHIDMFKYIMEEFDKSVWYIKTLENSWKFAKNKEALTKRLTEKMSQSKQRQIEEDKLTIHTTEKYIIEYRKKLKTFYDTLTQKMRSVEVETENLKNVSSSIIKDLDLIIGHEKVKDLQFKDDKIIVYTNPLYIHSDSGKRYYGGNYRIELKPENAEIYFFGDNERKSYWSSHDPHPHVSGNTGEACLGNVASTIAELSSQMQLYALVLVAIDFLESANTSDWAGKNVVHWDEVDDDGNVIKEAEQDLVECSECGSMEHEDELVSVYDSYDAEEGRLDDARYVCPSCREDYYSWSEDAEEYIRD